jgi:NSS family neurotransmitter:Na+ symporter
VQGERFKTRQALIFAALGMAIGTGNIWRFPRVAAQHGENGAGAFIVAWLIGLFLWSVPLLMVELSMGRRARLGTVGSFGRLLGPGKTWMGGWVTFCSVAILFYYSVITGWCLRYLVAAVAGWDSAGPVLSTAAAEGGAISTWIAFSESWQPAFFHMVALSAAVLVVMGGVVRGIERANRILIPLLFGLLVLGALRTLSLPGAGEGVAFLFRFHLPDFLQHKLWLDALTQSAWSTGAGWGLLLTYAVYSRQDQNVTLSCFITGLGNNFASILAALIIIPTAFAALPSAVAREVLGQAGPANTGMAFIWIPHLLQQFPAGRFFLVLFFLTLSLAALTSLISLVELPVRNLIDAGLSRRRALGLVWLVCFLCGLPSAISLRFLENQDWVWSVGLLISGFLFSMAAVFYGLQRFRRSLAGGGGHQPAGRWFSLLVGLVIPLEFSVMFIWWLWQSTRWAPLSWWNPLERFGLSTCLVQWAAVLILLLLAGKRLHRWTAGRTAAADKPGAGR